MSSRLNTAPAKRDESRLPQFDFFELLDASDAAYSQAIELYDSLPKYLWDKRVQPFSQKNTRIVRVFKNRGQEYELRIYGAILEDKLGEQHIAFPSRREEVVEDALRKLTVSGGRIYFAQNATWCEFTLHELQRELKQSGHSFSKPEIKEALNVCHRTRIELLAGGKKVTSGYILPSLTLVSGDELKENKDAHCLVRFHEMVSTCINDLRFRQYNYAVSMSFKHSLARSLFKRLSYNWRQARLGASFGPIFLTTVFRDSGRELKAKMHYNRRRMVEALDELIEKQVLLGYDYEDAKEGKKLLDIKYWLSPHPQFVRDVKRSNHFSTELTEVQAVQAPNPMR